MKIPKNKNYEKIFVCIELEFDFILFIFKKV